MGRGVKGRASPLLTNPAAAGKVAETLQALASPNRLRILTRLRQSPCSVTELSAAVGMEQPAVSHQLRLLRNLGLVAGDRSGRNIVYRLYDSHVASLLDEAVYHIEHLRLGVSDTMPHPVDPLRPGWPRERQGGARQ
ncbi:ArsR/SmtB family transcription factor [Mycobacterium xenopi]|uniref:ArsR/SmtB family transcription factor n=1 Tax=Mycobacterium xenopi TaxID=1789 RepID=UPI00031DDAAC|nr:metalloregulator ArsR/SmtB family transcription factor [Mycobacterium xenopi]MDA3638015.1 metalloregulator ArsR/SmtB family transcription factor [Mycobacterium xenopi]MDA3656084.1 metalloregulator ArsR/SmtB family transcription factor [Mycobacterium xenopi]ORX09612.1 ArsR family transcriptional regulator [Mycobacterium xenopi]